MQFVFLAQTNAKDGRHEVFNRWYDEQHLKEVLALPGVEWAQRFEGPRQAEFQYYALYGIEAGSRADVWSAVSSLRDTMVGTDALENFGGVLLGAIGDRVSAADLEASAQ
jgi:hypothetical protein